MNIHPLTIEKISAEHPLTDKDFRRYDRYFKTKTFESSTKERVAQSYELLRNEFAKAVSQFSDDDELWIMAQAHGRLYRSLDVDSAKEGILFTEHCLKAYDALKARLTFLREKRWINA